MPAPFELTAQEILNRVFDDTNNRLNVKARLVNAEWLVGRNAADDGDVNALRVNANDAVELGTAIGARVYNDAAITVSTASVTALTFNQERFDSDGTHSTVSNTGRLTAVTAGLYMITAHIEWGSSTTGFRQIGLRLNGATAIAYNNTAPISGSWPQSIAAIYRMAADDYMEVAVYQTSGGNLDVLAGGNFTPEFAMARIGA